MSHPTDSKDILTFHYIFRFPGKGEKRFLLKLDRERLSLIPAIQKNLPPWTELDNNKCPNCPFDSKVVIHCPVAKNLSELLGQFSDAVSYEEIDLTIETEARTYTRHTTLQKGMSSMMGIYMVTSGCPILDKLKPMVRHHLPFATLEETQYRVLSMYLLAQYFLSKRGKCPDWDLKQLAKIYDDVRIVNKAFGQRVTTAVGQDAVPNALVILNTFADSVSFALDKNALQKIEHLFTAYLQG